MLNRYRIAMVRNPTVFLWHAVITDSECGRVRGMAGNAGWKVGGPALEGY
jgi:hypothetical protein